MTIHFPVHRSLVVGTLLCAACLPLCAARSQAVGREGHTTIRTGDELLSTEDTAYDAVRKLAQQGLVTGFADGSFSGKRPMSHGQFATAIRSLAMSAAWRFEVGASWRPHASPPEGWSALQREARRIAARSPATEPPPLLRPASERVGREAHYRREWVWGPSGSGILYVRDAFNGTPERLFAIDLPSGTILQAQSVPVRVERSAKR